MGAESLQIQVGTMDRWSVHSVELLGILYAINTVNKVALQHYHGGDVREAAKDGYDTFERREFLAKLPSLRQRTFSGRTIKSSFKSCGIFSFDPSIVLDPLKRKLPLDNENPLEMWFGEGNGPTGSPKSTIPSSITSSPKTLQRFQKDIKKVQRGLDGIEEALDSLSLHLKGQID